MTGKGVGGLVRRLGATVADPGAADRDLLRAYLTDRDEAAFALLVRRHDRLVRAAVGRVLADPHDAADARQATFLVLLRRAGSVPWRADLGPWLYGVAHRVAVRLRARDRRRPGRLGDTDPPDPAGPPDPSWREACDLLHAELDRLPDRYRLPLLLCYLEGHTRDAAGAALGVSGGAVKGRVRRGLELLRRRLDRRGVSLSVGLLAATARPAAGGKLDVAGPPSPRVAALVQEIAVNHGLPKVMLGLLGVAGLAAGLAWGGPDPVPDPPTPPRSESVVVAVAPAPRPASVFLVEEDEAAVILGTDGCVRERPDPPLRWARLSPDGQWLAGNLDDPDQGVGTFVVRRRDGTGEPHVIPHSWKWDFPRENGCQAVWSADGRRLLVCEAGQSKVESKTSHFIYDRTTRAVTELTIPRDHWAIGFHADGNRFLTNSWIALRRGSLRRHEWVTADGSADPEPLTPDDLAAHGGRLSPDGKRLLYLAAPRPAMSDATAFRLYVLDLTTREAVAIAGPGVIDLPCWSPDGKRVAYTRQTDLKDPQATDDREITLYTADADGRNRAAVTTRRAKAQWYEFSKKYEVAPRFFRVFDWR